MAHAPGRGASPHIDGTCRGQSVSGELSERHAVHVEPGRGGLRGRPPLGCTNARGWRRRGGGAARAAGLQLSPRASRRALQLPGACRCAERQGQEGPLLPPPRRRQGAPGSAYHRDLRRRMLRRGARGAPGIARRHRALRAGTGTLPPDVAGVGARPPGGRPGACGRAGSRRSPSARVADVPSDLRDVPRLDESPRDGRVLRRQRFLSSRAHGEARSWNRLGSC